MAKPGNKPGTPRMPGSGRKKGTPNKRSQAIIERIESSGKDPLAVMLDLLDDEDANLRFQASKELLGYLYAKRKAIEVTGADGAPIQSQVVATVETVKEAIIKVRAARGLK